MPYYVRLMRLEDAAQVSAIDREAFPTQLPAPDFKHELRNHLYHYIVAIKKEYGAGNQAVAQAKTTSENDRNDLAAILSKLGRRLFSGEPVPPSREHIVGFVGLWALDDEAHIINIAVREACRRQGVGDLLLISAFDLALELKASIMTLEVRVSNTIARNFYTKYSFSQVGLRRGYYIDNREDALLMSTPDITLSTSRMRLQQLREDHSRKCEVVLS